MRAATVDGSTFLGGVSEIARAQPFLDGKGRTLNTYTPATMEFVRP